MKCFSLFLVFPVSMKNKKNGFQLSGLAKSIMVNDTTKCITRLVSPVKFYRKLFTNISDKSQGVLSPLPPLVNKCHRFSSQSIWIAAEFVWISVTFREFGVWMICIFNPYTNQSAVVSIWLTTIPVFSAVVSNCQTHPSRFGRLHSLWISLIDGWSGLTNVTHKIYT